MTDDLSAESAQLARDRAVLDDAGAVLAARARLDGLLLDALASQGFAQPELSRLSDFLGGGEVPSAVDALVRLQALPLAGGGAP